MTADTDSFGGSEGVRGRKAAALAERVAGCGFDFFYLTHECKGEQMDALDEDSVRTATCMTRVCARYARQRAAVLRENLGQSMRARTKRRVKGERATFFTLTIPTPATWNGTAADRWPYVDRLRDSFKVMHEGWRHVWTWLQHNGVDWAYRSTECGCGGNPHVHAIVYGKRQNARAVRREWTRFMATRGVLPTGGAKELWVYLERVTRRGRAAGDRRRGYSAEGAIAELAKYLVKSSARAEGREYTQIDPRLAAYVALAATGLRMQQGYGDARTVTDRVLDEKEERECLRCGAFGGKWHLGFMPREDWPAFVAKARQEGRAFSRKRDPPSSRSPPAREPGEEG